MQETYTISEEI